MRESEMLETEKIKREEIKTRKDALRAQFQHPESFIYGNETIEVRDIHPEKLKTPVPVFFGPGWAASDKVYEECIVGMANGDGEEGRRVMTVFAPHGIDAEHVEGSTDIPYAASELRKAAAMLRMLEDKDVEQVDVVAHSEAAIWSLIVASIHPEKVRNIVLVAPAGLIGKDNFPRLGIGFSLGMVHEALNTENLPRPQIERTVQPGGGEDLLGALKNIFGSPLQSVKEVLAISDSDIRDMLENLKKQGKGIAVVHGVHDEFFPTERMKETAGIRGAADEVKNSDVYVDRFFDMPGTHNDLNLNPHLWTTVINHALTELEERKMKKND